MKKIISIILSLVIMLWSAYPSIIYANFGATFYATSTTGGGIAPNLIGGNLQAIIGTATSSALFPYNQIAAWGDSLTWGQNQPGQTYPNQLEATSTYQLFNGGVSGETSSQIAARMIGAIDRAGNPSIIWVGRNDITSSTTLVANIQAMINSLQAPKRYLVLSITNNATEASNTANYIQIAVDNAAIAAAFPSHYVDVRSYLVSKYNPGIPQDVIDHANDVPPSSLRDADGIHFNTLGYRYVADDVFLNFGLLFAGNYPTGHVVNDYELGNVLLNPPPIGYGTPNDLYAKSIQINASSTHTPSSSLGNGDPGLFSEYGTTPFTSTSSLGDYSDVPSLNGIEEATSTGWTSTGWTGSFNSFTHTSGNTNALSNSVVAVTATKYTVRFTVSGQTTSGFSATFGGANLTNSYNQSGSNFNTNGTYYEGVTTLTTAGLIFTPAAAGTFDGTISNISIQKLVNPSVAVWKSFDGNGSTSLEIRAPVSNSLGAIPFLSTNNADNSFFGYRAGQYANNSYYNTIIGGEAGAALTTATNDTYIGAGAGTFTTMSYANTAVGASALRSVVAGGGQNTAIGFQSLFTCTACQFDVALGSSALQGATTGSNNVALGFQAGITITTGSNDTIVGFGANVDTASRSNAAAFGNNAIVGCTNCLVLGGTGTTNFMNVGIGTSTPSTATLSVYPTNNINPFLVASTSNATDFTVLANGNVGIATSTPSSLFQVNSAATTTISLDNTVANKGSCIEMKDADGVGYTYISANNGVLTASVNSCK